MSNQDMQFADPEWRSTEQGDGSSDSKERAVPLPESTHVDPREQTQSQAPALEPQQGYVGGGHAEPAPQMMWGRRYGPRQYRRRRLWMWIILLLIILALVGGGFGSFFGISHRAVERRTFSMSATPTPFLAIQETTGTIRVHAESTNDITIVATKTVGGFFGNPDDIQVQYNESSDDNSVKVSVNEDSNFFSSMSVDFDVTVPTNITLGLKTTTGTIDVSNVNGRMSIASDTGTVTASNDMLTGSSDLRTQTGTITFNGSISIGSYLFLTETGSVDVTLPSNSVFHVDAMTDTGSIDTDFPNLNIQRHGSGAEMQGDTGTAPSDFIRLVSSTGSINLRKG